MNLPEILGYATAVLLIASFAMKTIMRLRILAIAGSVVLIVYAILVQHWPLLVIAAILAAVNVWRLVEMRRLIGAARAVSAGSRAPVSVEWLLPYMRPIDVPTDHVLFRKGDIADAMYFISAGRVRFEEIGVEVGKGSLFGEIGIFSVDQIRTATAKCLEPCSLLLITGEKVRELYYQNPEFGFYLVGLITRRLMEDLAMARPLKP
jgi:hypothetical protein